MSEVVESNNSYEGEESFNRSDDEVSMSGDDAQRKLFIGGLSWQTTEGPLVIFHQVFPSFCPISVEKNRSLIFVL